MPPVIDFAHFQIFLNDIVLPVSRVIPCFNYAVFLEIHNMVYNSTEVMRQRDELSIKRYHFEIMRQHFIDVIKPLWHSFGKEIFFEQESLEKMTFEQYNEMVSKMRNVHQLVADTEVAVIYAPWAIVDLWNEFHKHEHNRVSKTLTIYQTLALACKYEAR